MLLSFCSAAAAQGVWPEEVGVSDDEGGRIGWGRSQRGRSVLYSEGNGEATKGMWAGKKQVQIWFTKSHSTDRV